MDSSPGQSAYVPPPRTTRAMCWICEASASFDFLARLGARVAQPDDYIERRPASEPWIWFCTRPQPHRPCGEDVVVLCTKASKIEVVGDQNISRSR